MSYSQGFTNAKNVLADFISVICFDELASDKFETWQLVYPAANDKETAFKSIVRDRRATVSTTFIPTTQWKNNETFKIDQEYLDSFSGDLFELKLSNPIIDLETVKLSFKGYKGNFYNREISDYDEILEKLGVMEFYVDVENQKVILLKDTLKLEDKESIVCLISYQTYAEEPVTWYVDFRYPEYTIKQELNYNYFEWTFGDEIDDEYTVINKKRSPTVMRCFWQTTNKEIIPTYDWLPIEYFISWDDSAISFVMCADPVTDNNYVMHAFNYIGALESIKNADYDDIKSNFGSCGNYDLTVRAFEGDIKIPDSSKIVSTMTFLQKEYNGFFEERNVKTLLKLDNVAHGNYTIADKMIGNANLLEPQTQQYIVGDPSVSNSDSHVKVKSPIGTPMSLHTVYNNPPVSKFLLPSEIIVVDLKDVNTELKLLNSVEVTPYESINITVAKDETDVVLANDTSVIKISGGLPSDNNTRRIINRWTKITLLDDLRLWYYGNDLVNLPINTIFYIPTGELCQVTAATPVIVDNVKVIGSPRFVLKNSVTVHKPDPILVRSEEVLPANTIIRLKSNCVDTRFHISYDYIIEFHYREPFLGDMHYDFVNEWFSGGSNKSIGDFTGQTPIVTPIVAENMLPSSKFENITRISETFTGNFSGKNKVMNRLSFSSSNKNNFHKNTVIVPEIITNEKTGESWFLKSIGTDNAIEKTDNSITNICMYPKQVYVGNFYYKKRTLNKCIITLGQHDIVRLKIVLTDKNNTVLTNFYGNNTYKNLQINRNRDNGLTLNVDFNNLVDEEVFLLVYRINDYFSHRSNYYSKYFFLPMTANAYFEYDLKSTEFIAGIRGNAGGLWSGEFDNRDHVYSAVAIHSNPEPNTGFIVPQTLKFMTIKLNSIHETFKIHPSFSNVSVVWG